MTMRRHVDGRYYPSFHAGWGGFSEELFFYTSRYYGVTESFLRGLTGREDFSMSGYKATNLGEAQRPVMAAVLTYPPTRESGLAVAAIVEAVRSGRADVDPDLCERYPADTAEDVPGERPVGGEPSPLAVSPLEPWLSMAERLLMPVAVDGRQVEVDMKVLAGHLDSPNPVVRANLQRCIIDLHEAGYRLRNRPRLTHREAATRDD